MITSRSSIYGTLTFSDADECNHVIKYIKDKCVFDITTGHKKYTDNPLNFDFGLFSDMCAIYISQNEKFHDHVDTIVKSVDRYRKSHNKKYADDD